MSTSRSSRIASWSTVVVVVFTTLGVVAHAQDEPEQIDELISSYHQLRLFNGTVLVAHNGEVLFEKGYGMANFEWDVPNSPDTKFRIGSITKQFTAALILQLVAEDKLALDSTLSELLPYYREDTGSKINVHHLLNHTSGIPSYTGMPDFIQEVSRDSYGVEEFVTDYCSGDLEFEPGSEFRYNNSGYFLLGAIIEQATGQRFEQVLRERILDPLGMQSSGYDHSAPIIHKRASGYERAPEGFRNADYLDMSLPYAAGSMYSTVRDLYRWDQALYTDRLLSSELKDKLFEPGKENYAYGWVVTKREIGLDGAERTVIAHGGGINGFNTLIERVVDDRNLVVLLNNTGRTRLQEMSTGILDVLYGRTPAVPKQSIGEVISASIARDGIEVAIARYRRLKDEQPEAYDFGENELNLLGYRLLGSGELEAATAIFRLNVEMFPAAWNAHDSLGEALAAAGRKDEAIRSYARSLELNPGNRDAVEKLEQLTRP